MSRLRMILPVACLIAAAMAGGLYVWRAGTPAPEPQPAVASIGGAFQLIDQDGRPVDQSVLNGKWSAVFFGFTYCPDVCPGTLQALGAAAAQLGDRADDLQVVFISIDPERDTPAQMKAYLAAQNLPVKTLGLTGSPQQVAAAAKAYRAFYQKDGEGEAYLMNHTSTVYLMDPKGRFDRPLAYGLTPQQMAELIKTAMR